MRFETRLLLLLLLSAFFAACPVKPGQEQLQMDRLSPQVFRYGGIRVALLDNDRSPMELRIVVQNSGTAAEFLALETAFQFGPPDMAQSEFQTYRDTYFLDFSLLHGDGQSILRLSCLPELLQRNWEFIGNIFAQVRLDTADISAAMEQQMEIQRFYKLRTAFGMEQLMRRELGCFPEGLGPWPGIDPEAVRDVEQVQSAWQQLRQKQHVSLVAAGAVDAEKIGNLLFGSLSELPGDPDSLIRRPIPAIVPSTFHSVASEAPLMGMGLVMQFEDASEQPGGVELLAEIVRLRLQEVFARDAATRKGLSVRAFCRRAPAIFIYLQGTNVIPQAELAMSELRKLKAEWISEEEFVSARNVALTRTLERHASNRSWADEVAERGFSESGSYFVDLAGIKGASSKTIGKTLQSNWRSAHWFLVGDDAKVDENALLRF